MIRSSVRTIILGLTLALACGSSEAAAQPTSSKWVIEARDGRCTILYGLNDFRAERSSHLYGASWAPGEGLGFQVFDRRQSAPATSIALEVGTAHGQVFSGSAEAEQLEGLKVYEVTVEDRKDAASSLSGDITFGYRDFDGRAVSAVIPAGQQVPRIHRCMAEARTQAAAIASTPAAQRAQAAEARSEPAVSSYGSGVFVDRNGHVLTNAHVIEGCRVVRAPGFGAAQVVATEESSDLALLRFRQAPRAFVRARNEPLKLGESVIVAGYPLRDILANGLNITTGNVSALSGIGGDRRFLQITAPVQAGNSGGPVLDSSGRLVGLVVAGFKNTSEVQAENINWAVSPFVIQAFLAEHNVTLGQGRSGDLRGTVIAEQAKAHTTLLECLS
jgi:S1-C subfamily serine protease